MGNIEESEFRTSDATIDLLLFGVKNGKSEKADVKKEQVVDEMNRMGKIEERSFRTWDANIYLLLFGVKKRKKEQADVKKEQVVYAMK